jgi:tRNA(Ile)-lysidine synthetase-like protein
MRNFRIPNVNNVELLDTFKKHPSTTKYCIQDVNTKEYLIGNITSNCSDLCFQENVIIDQYNKRCICNENYKFEYNSQCYQKCPNGLLQIKTDKYICSNSVSGYYLDNKDHIYKKCYYKCNKCSQSGNDLIHNCDECLDNFQFFNKEILHNCYTVDEINELQINNQNYIDNVHKKLLIDRLSCGIISCDTKIRTRQSGDIFSPLGRGCTKTVKKLFSEMKLSADDRETRLLIANGSRVLWIEGIGVSEDAAVLQNSSKYYYEVKVGV